PESEKAGLLDHETLPWRLMRLMRALEDDPRFARPAAFIAGQPLRRHQLANHLAPLFGQYMLHCPGLLAAWERNLPPESDETLWQALLWRALANETPWHDARLATAFLERAKAGALPAPMPGRRLFAFGFSTLAPVWCELLFTLAKHRDVHFFHFNPCRELWDQAKSMRKMLDDADESAWPFNNTLLGSLAGAAKPLYTTLLGDHMPEPETGVFDTRPPATLLAHVQRHIQDNTTPETPVALEADDSIQFHVCHSPLREVEVLHDLLLRLSRDRPEPGGVRVYAPDISVYTPHIRAVFGAAKPGEPGHIPHLLAESAPAREDPACVAFLELFDALESRFEASRVLALLLHPVIRARFGIADADLPVLDSLLVDSRLHWGVSPEHREAEGAPPEYIGTWRFALDRLLLGAVLPGAPTASVTLGQNARCLPLAQAAAHRGLVGRLADFVHALETARARCAAQRASEWVRLLGFLLDRFFDASQASGAFLAFRQKTAELGGLLRAARVEDTPFSHGLVRAHIAGLLNAAGADLRLAAGVVTFASLPPGPLPPARVNVLLGLEKGAWPRRHTPPHFDLLARAPQKIRGFVDPRGRDRLAFLHFIMASREKMILSWRGLSGEDNTPLPPALVVTELRDHIAQNFIIAGGKTPEVSHPPHPFSPRVFEPGNRVPSFSGQNFEIANAIRDFVPGKNSRPAQKTQGASLWQVPPLATPNDLVSFFQDPAKFYLTRHVGLWLDGRAAAQPGDEEPFEFSSELEKYGVKEDLLGLASRDASLRGDALRDYVLASGMLVPNVSAGMDLLDTTRRLLEKILEITRGARPQNTRVRVEALPCGLCVEGALGPHYPEIPALVLARPASEIKPKDVLRAHVSHLCACAGGLALTTHCVAASGGAGGQIFHRTFAPVPVDGARAGLDALAPFFIRHQTSPLFFTPDFFKIFCANCETAHDVISRNWRQLAPDDEYAADEKKRVFYPNPWVLRAFGDAPPDTGSDAWREFENLCEILRRDLVETLEGETLSSRTVFVDVTTRGGSTESRPPTA
ncbi:MAG: exodeoxyribonuclease V subunit gamma, partial [Kiritimatiellaeota bacterium]|nr:exodeoxyribonuclease V subunit gamma [Kiritimatiellota bacterium]